MRPRIFGLLFSTIMFASAHGAGQNEGWLLAKGTEDGKEVIYRFREAMPSAETVQRYQILATIEWAYSPNSIGMPQQTVSKGMYELEEAIETQLENASVCTLAFSRTGNGKKSWGYYITNKSAFEAGLAQGFPKAHEAPIHVAFSPEPSWSTLRSLQQSVAQ